MVFWLGIHASNILHYQINIVELESDPTPMLSEMPSFCPFNTLLLCSNKYYKVTRSTVCCKVHVYMLKFMSVENLLQVRTIYVPWRYTAPKKNWQYHQDPDSRSKAGTRWSSQDSPSPKLACFPMKLVPDVCIAWTSSYTDVFPYTLLCWEDTWTLYTGHKPYLSWWAEHATWTLQISL